MVKEIDSKSDLLEEETMAIPAEHRSFPDQYDMNDDDNNNNNHNNHNGAPIFMKNKNIPSNFYNNNNNNNNKMPIDASQNELWPMVRPESSMIKVTKKKSSQQQQQQINIYVIPHNNWKIIQLNRLNLIDDDFHSYNSI